ncbi:DNA mismatch repair protein MutH [Fructilactobacillus myrtifloralis]|uniref:DNA mismatch repair protein MutH n=1 Tax=Fructilactobacillus myrtifloralis TaxID=2940301 RepID=A0ABY5BQJ3_9LACO|nr:Sau3AI family type II restriction endonuclease [Fructilactobacillus myrtifloralis]USS85744.1 DNA mismatch repair protein MutH [Fructilactobacillus myrtifloralis]
MEYESKESVHNKALKIKGKTQGELAKELNLKVNSNKNLMGDIFEAWFGKEKDNKSEPDLGVSELKATPFKKLKRKTNGNLYSSKERLVLNIIDYNKLDKESFDNSHFLHKNRVLEIAFYEYLENISPDNFEFKYIIMYQMQKSPKDFEIIKKDWEIIQDFVHKGKAEELSESATNYLAACTKGANKNSKRQQPHSNQPAKQRAFSFKNKFMTYLLNEKVIGNKHDDAVIKNSIELKNNSLEEVIEKRFKNYVGLTDIQIAKKLDVNLITTKNKAPKNFHNMIVRAILGINKNNGNLNNIEEFEKSSIIPKTIQFDSKGINKESMSLNYFKFCNLVNEYWDDEDEMAVADLNIYLSESKFLFIVFQEDENGNNILKGIKFYTFPKELINGPIKEVWEDTKNKVKTGVKLYYDGNHVHNNFIKQKNNMIIHVRPHASTSSYVNSSSSSRLPTPAQWTNKPADFDDNFMTIQSFWINNTFIRKVVKNLISKKTDA